MFFGLVSEFFETH